MVRIITDSGSDILPDKAAEWNITVLPLTVHFGNEEYEDGVTLPRDVFYQKLAESDSLPKTSQISPAVYEAAFKEAVQNGDEVVCLTISSGLSGCCQSACIAKGDLERVYVVDTLQACGSQYILVQHAVQLRDQGKTAKEISEILQAERVHARQITILDTLKYLQLGGRISKTAAFAGEILSLKPVVTFQDGVVQMLGKARGAKNSHKLLMQLVHKKHGIDWGRPVVYAYTGNSTALVNQLIDDTCTLYEGRKKADLPISRVGATIGTYTGPGAVSFSFFEGSEE